MNEGVNLSVEELVRRSLDSSFEAEDEAGNARSLAAWEAMGALVKLPNGEVLESVARLLRSPWQRSRGANILGQFQPESKTG